MITCELTGNLGNQMMGYVVTRTVAETLGYEYGFNRTPSHDYYGGAEQMVFMNIDYGKEHLVPYGQMPEGIIHTWKEKYITFKHIDSVDYHPYQPDIFDIQDNTKLVIRCCQDARYLKNKKEEIKKWLTIRSENIVSYNQVLEKEGIVLDGNTCILNVRGGEYRNLPNVLIKEPYWRVAQQFMHSTNPETKFIIITDDIGYAREAFPQIKDIFHFSIGMDYYIINQAKNLILSNSSFAILPAWLNPNNPFVIAPRFWARHNVSSGYWASSDVFTFGWNFLDRNGYFYEE